MESVIYNPLEAYETRLKDLHEANTEAFFAELVERSGVDIEKNRETVRQYDEYKEKVLSGEIELTLPSFQPSWNARGEVCTYDWTMEELIILGADIEAKVRPLVSLQQSMESQIMSATTREEILSVKITFE